MNIIFLLLITLYIYILSIFLYQIIKKTDTKTARKQVHNFLKGCFGINTNTLDKPKPNFPVYIGIDNMGYPNANIIDKEFSNLRSKFDCCYFDKYLSSPNRICYQFKIGNSNLKMSDYDLVKYCTNICKNILSTYLHRKFPYINSIPNFLVVVTVNSDILSIYIATNQQGINENFEESHRLHKFYNNQNAKPHNTNKITERWDES